MYIYIICIIIIEKPAEYKRDHIMSPLNLSLENDISANARGSNAIVELHHYCIIISEIWSILVADHLSRTAENCNDPNNKLQFSRFGTLDLRYM